MIKNYLITLDLFSFLLCVIILFNLYLNEKSNGQKQSFSKKIWILLASISLFSIFYHTLYVLNIVSNTFYVMSTIIFLGISYYLIMLILKYLLNFSFAIKKSDSGIIVLVDIIFYIALSLLLVLFFTGRIICKLDCIPIIKYFSITHLYIISMIIVSAFIFHKNKDNMMKVLWDRIIILLPMSLLLVFIDLVIKTVSGNSYIFMILPISLSGVLTNIYIIFHSQPYDQKFCTLGQQSLDTMIQNVIESNKSDWIIKLAFQNINELENKINPVQIDKEMTEIIVYMDKLTSCSNIYKIRDDIILHKDVEADNKNDFELKDILVSIIKKINSFTESNYIYKLLVINNHNKIASLSEYYSLNSVIFKKCDYNSFYICQDEDIEIVKKEKIIEKELVSISKANDLNDSRIIVNLQPIYNTKTNTFRTAEALVRMDSKNTGLIFPDQFIYIAERMGIINIITKIVLNKVCIYIKDIQKKNIDIEAITVNISPRDLQYTDFTKMVLEIINFHNVDYSKIRLEFIESLEIGDYKNVIDKIDYLNDLGIKFYLDDFGSGYSNLDRVITLPFSTIKFDKSIVWGAINDKKKYHMLKEITNVFKSLGFNILYEGIENFEYEELAIELGVTDLQGYKYSKPVPYEDAIKLFKKHVL